MYPILIIAVYKYNVMFQKYGESINIAPVVFACNIDYELENDETRQTFGEISYMVSQTPGVWLDFQSYLVKGDLHIMLGQGG